ncbi:MAG: HlyC/CorC family transporter [Pseudotabrizicola sp.]|uniref:HlyC/CorC family transporter n=1 Tax=Pseudotabrizicola sp. TaxID=2939647 RepID=UPI00271A2D5B|nr:HlyC/CorC family transporter [Pseudotabrizicola sp.]MDO8884097.1 HlyC/CorC family transporter [Pseudotabrizicola sp.]MDP2083219.1 HlyC/CorC family transporter [Pseudotabrizicola sp.]MDZ7572636.1 HlyC/CorC family transporter [Pseudotabrizicola sp.]
MENVALDTAFWLTAAGILCLLVLSAFFSGSETALTAASRAKLKTSADKGSLGAASAMKITEDNERMIGAILLGNNVVNILSASLATAMLTRMLGDSGVAFATLGMTILVLIFGEVLPKTLAITFPEAFATRVAPVIRVLILVFSPIVSVVRVLVRGVLRLFGVKADPEGKFLALREEIMGAIALGHSEGAVEKEDRDRLLGALDLGSRTVDEIMRHRRHIEMLDADQSPDQIITKVLASPHTRLPLFRGDEENILGVIHAKDLLREVDRLLRSENGAVGSVKNLDIVKVAMKPYFIPDTTALDEQMRQFLKRRTHFALVVDEYGGLQGLITLEDILEEIVGEITDEFDVVQKDSALKRAENGDYLVEGQMTIRDLNRAMDWNLPDDEANTIAGLVIHEAQMIPNEGQAFSFHGFRFEVVQKRENRIVKLKMRPL